MKRHCVLSVYLIANIIVAMLQPSRQLLAQGSLPRHEGNPLERIANRNRLNGRMKDSTLDIIGRWGWGIDRGVASMGNYLLTGAGPTLLWVDVTNKARPVVIWDTLVYLSDVAIQDSMGYVLTGSSLKIMDLHKPKTPAIVGEVNLESGYSLAVEGPFVFVKESFPSYSVDCVDVSVPTSPYIRSSVASGILTGPITVSKRNLYVGDPMLSYSPEYVDASNPDSMVVSPVNLPAIMSAECAGDSLLLVNAVALLQIY